jgi:hypothetical protein
MDCFVTSFLAMSCQTEIARKIREKEADYLLAVKENQKTLYNNIKEYFEGMESREIGDMPEDIWQGEEEVGHGRKERREIRTATGLEWLENRGAWQDVRTIIQYWTFRTVTADETAKNQARLEYYTTNESRLKFFAGGSANITAAYADWWWEASPSAADAYSFCAVYHFGYASSPQRVWGCRLRPRFLCPLGHGQSFIPAPLRGGRLNAER